MNINYVDVIKNGYTEVHIVYEQTFIEKILKRNPKKEIYVGKEIGFKNNITWYYNSNKCNYQQSKKLDNMVENTKVVL